MAKSSRPKVSLNIPKKKLVDGNTRLHIDYSWWEDSGRSLESYLQSKLGSDVSMEETGNPIDMIDMETGEVRQLSGFEYAIQTYFNQMPDDFMQKGSLVDACFSLLLSEGNRPIKISEIAEKVGRPAETIARTVAGRQVFLGIRAYTD